MDIYYILAILSTIALVLEISFEKDLKVEINI